MAIVVLVAIVVVVVVGDGGVGDGALVCSSGLAWTAFYQREFVKEAELTFKEMKWLWLHATSLLKVAQR